MSDDQLAERMQKARLDLYDVASDLRPLATPDQLAGRLHRVADELRRIYREVLLLQHVESIEEGGLEEQLADIDKRLADGWVPEAQPMDEAIAALREQFA